MSGIGPAGSTGGVSYNPGAAPPPAAAASAASSAASVARGSLPRNPLSAAAMSPPPDERYEVDVPMQAFDHLTQTLLAAGGRDGIVARAEAKGLVEGLRDEGRGTEALAAEQLFAMIDEFDSARGAKVTGYDFQQARPLAEMWLKSGDGAQSPMGRALHELGRTLAMPPLRQHTTVRLPARGLDHVTSLIRQSSTDAIISRADVKALIGNLEAQGRGTEANAVDIYFRFLDHRDHRPGARITADDLNKGARYAREHLLLNKDTNNDQYYQPNELANFSKTAKAFLEVGRISMFAGARADVVRPGPTPRPVGPTQFDENQPFPQGWQPQRTIDTGSFRVVNGAVELDGIAGQDLKETRLLEAAFGAIWARSTQHRVHPAGSLADVGQNGSMRIGSWDDPDTGETYTIAHWNDIDDDSNVFYFKEDAASTPADPQFVLAHNVYLN